MPEQKAGALAVVIAPSLGCGAPSTGLIRERITEAVARAARALRLPGGGAPTVEVSIGPVEQGPYAVTAGDITFIAQPTALVAGAGPVSVADTIAATICTERSILCAITGLTDPGLQRIVRIGAAVPSAPLSPVSPDRACEEVLAARTGPVLAVSVGADLDEATKDALATALDATRREFFTYWGIPVPVIHIETGSDLHPGLMRLTLLDTPFAYAMPPDVDGQQPVVDVIRDATRNIAASNVASLITVRGVDLLLGVFARTDPWLVGALRERYDRVDLTGVFRTMLTYQLPINGLRPILERLLSLQGGMDPGDVQTVVMTPTTRYFFGDPAAGAYSSLANVSAASVWQYTLRRDYAQEVLRRAAAEPSG